MNFESVALRTFSTSRKGWDTKEVSTFLRDVADALNQMSDENDGLRSEILRLETEMKESRQAGNRMRREIEQLRTAQQKVGSEAEVSAVSLSYQAEQERREILRRARAEAEVIVRDAEKKAERIMVQGNIKLNTLKEQLDLLHTKKIALITRIKSVLRAQIDFLAALERGGDSSHSVSHPLQSRRMTREGIGADDLSSIMDRLDNIEG